MRDVSGWWRGFFSQGIIIKARVGNVEETSESTLDFESIRPNEMIGQAYYRPVTATDTGFFSFFCWVFDLLITVGM